MKISVGLMATLAVAGLSGCASISQGTSQILSFKIEPKEAKCVLTRAGDGELGSVSGRSNTISVGKDKDDIIVQCTAPGYEAKTTRVVSGATTAGVTGVLLDLGITDMITGAMYSYPNDITITMENDGPQPVQTARDISSGNTPATAAVAPKSKEERLKELKQLHESDLIGREIYLERQKEILAAP
jgi:hypothetical protein